MPPNAAPIAYAISFVRTSGMPIETAATSSSRSATQARPSRESRSRTLTNSTSIRIAKITQYHGLRCSWSNVPMPGEVDRVDRADPDAAAGQRLPAAEVDALAVDRDTVDDLAEGERDDRDVVAAQPQRRQPDQRAEPGGDHDRDHQDQDEVQVDPDQVRRRADEASTWMWPLKKNSEPNQPARVGAERVERDVAEVEQAGEADDDVEPQRHHRVGERGDRRVQEPAALGEQEREHDPEHDQRAGQRPGRPRRQPRAAPWP